MRPGPDKPVFLSWQAPDDETPAADPNSAFWSKIPGVVMDTKRHSARKCRNSARKSARAGPGSNIYFSLYRPIPRSSRSKANPVITNETYHLWDKDCFEVYLGADFEHINRYARIPDVATEQTFLDLDIDSSKPRPGYNGEQKWNSGWTVKARVDEKKKIWCGEMKIPITAVDVRPPPPGNEMRINLCRQDGVGTNRDFIAWQPLLVWNPHHPEKFGTLRLVDADGKTPAVDQIH